MSAAAATGPFEALARAVLDACRARGIMLATAESCTGGMIAAALTDIAGSSDVVDRGFVTYSNEAKMEMIGVAGATLAGIRRGIARDRAGDGGRRAGAVARRHRAVGHRHRRAGRRFAGKAGRAGVVRTGHAGPRPGRRTQAVRGPRPRLHPPGIGADGAADGARRAWRSAAAERRRSCRRAFRTRRRTSGRRGRTSSPSARRGCGS